MLSASRTIARPSSASENMYRLQSAHPVGDSNDHDGHAGIVSSKIRPLERRVGE